MIPLDLDKLNTNLRALYVNHVGDKVRRIVLEGGTRSGKTYSAIEYMIDCAMSMDGLIARVVRADATTCRSTVVVDFKAIMAMKGLWDANRWNGTTMVYRFENGSEFLFNGTNDESKLHGLKQDVLLINEAMEVTYEAYKQLSYRTTTVTIIDYNPSLHIHWVYSKVLTLGKDDVVFIRSTYKDNPHLSRHQVSEIEATEPTPENIQRGTADAYQWDVYGLGRRGRREGRIFEHWETTTEWPEPYACQRYGYGLDFGFSLDPTALVECALHQDNLYFRQLIYERDLVVTSVATAPGMDSIERRMNALNLRSASRIWGDGARPDNIASLNMAGIPVEAATKGHDSILNGLALMRSRRIFVHEGSMDLQMEFEQYSWKKLVTGRWTQEPEDRFNHGIDAARYWCVMEINPTVQGVKGGRSRKPTKARSRLI